MNLVPTTKQAPQQKLRPAHFVLPLSDTVKRLLALRAEVPDDADDYTAEHEPLILEVETVMETLLKRHKKGAIKDEMRKQARERLKADGITNAALRNKMVDETVEWFFD